MENVKKRIDALFVQQAELNVHINDLVVVEVKKAGDNGLEVKDEDNKFKECSVTIVDRHDENVNIIIDRVRYRADGKGLEFHACEWDGDESDEWVHSSCLSQEAIHYIYQCIEF